jgi:hypothetical protein
VETFLNLAWAVLAVASAVLWMRTERRTGSECYLPLMALVLLLAILFPVISVSDDLWAMQNPAEADTCLRRNQTVACPHCTLPQPSSLPASLFRSIHEVPKEFCVLVETHLPNPADPALNPIDNRPPPAA